MRTNRLIIGLFLILAASTFIVLQRAPRSGSARVDDINISYVSYGHGKPLIMITGYSGTMDLWSRRFISELSRKYRVIIFDNRGMGKTASSSKKYTIELFAKDTAGLMDALHIKKAHILGWSLGTYIAQEFALNYPEKTDKLILYAADTGGRQAMDPDPKTLKVMQEMSGEGKQMLVMLFPQKWLDENPDPRKYFPKPTEATPPENIKRQFEAWREWRGTYSRLKGIKAPTLLITGTDDILTPPENSVMMARLIPDVKLVRVPGGGHGAMYQFPDKMAQEIVGFLGK